MAEIPEVPSDPTKRKALIQKTRSWELHLPGHKFVGPGTHLSERLARGDIPVSAIDLGALRHDLAYTSPSQAVRNRADVQLWRTATDVLKHNPADTAALAVAGAMGAKIALFKAGVTIPGLGGSSKPKGVTKEEWTVIKQQHADFAEEAYQRYLAYLDAQGVSYAPNGMLIEQRPGTEPSQQAIVHRLEANDTYDKLLKLTSANIDMPPARGEQPRGPNPTPSERGAETLAQRKAHATQYAPDFVKAVQALHSTMTSGDADQIRSATARVISSANKLTSILQDAPSKSDKIKGISDRSKAYQRDRTLPNLVKMIKAIRVYKPFDDVIGSALNTPIADMERSSSTMGFDPSDEQIAGSSTIEGKEDPPEPIAPPESIYEEGADLSELFANLASSIDSGVKPLHPVFAIANYMSNPENHNNLSIREAADTFLDRKGHTKASVARYAADLIADITKDNQLMAAFQPEQARHLIENIQPYLARLTRHQEEKKEDDDTPAVSDDPPSEPPISLPASFKRGSAGGEFVARPVILPGSEKAVTRAVAERKQAIKKGTVLPPETKEEEEAADDALARRVKQFDVEEEQKLNSDDFQKVWPTYRALEPEKMKKELTVLGSEEVKAYTRNFAYKPVRQWVDESNSIYQDGLMMDKLRKSVGYVSNGEAGIVKRVGMPDLVVLDQPPRPAPAPLGRFISSSRGRKTSDRIPLGSTRNNSNPWYTPKYSAETDLPMLHLERNSSVAINTDPVLHSMLRPFQTGLDDTVAGYLNNPNIAPIEADDPAWALGGEIKPAETDGGLNIDQPMIFDGGRVSYGTSGL